MSFKEFDINPLYCVSLPGKTWQCGLKFTDNKIQTVQNEDMILLIENKIRGGKAASWVIDMLYQM